MKTFNPKSIAAHWNDMRDNLTSKYIRFGVSKENFKSVDLGDRVFLNHRRIKPAFYIVEELFAEQGRYEIKCIHEFDAIGYSPTRLNDVFESKVEVGDLVTVMGEEHIVEDLDVESQSIRIRPL